MLGRERGGGAALEELVALPLTVGRLGERGLGAEGDRSGDPGAVEESPSDEGQEARCAGLAARSGDEGPRQGARPLSQPRALQDPREPSGVQARPSGDGVVLRWEVAPQLALAVASHGLGAVWRSTVRSDGAVTLTRDRGVEEQWRPVSAGAEQTWRFVERPASGRVAVGVTFAGLSLDHVGDDGVHLLLAHAQGQAQALSESYQVWEKVTEGYRDVWLGAIRTAMDGTQAMRRQVGQQMERALPWWPFWPSGAARTAGGANAEDADSAAPEAGAAAYRAWLLSHQQPWREVWRGVWVRRWRGGVQREAVGRWLAGHVRRGRQGLRCERERRRR